MAQIPLAKEFGALQIDLYEWSDFLLHLLSSKTGLHFMSHMPLDLELRGKLTSNPWMELIHLTKMPTWPMVWFRGSELTMMPTRPYIAPLMSQKKAESRSAVRWNGGDGAHGHYVNKWSEGTSVPACSAAKGKSSVLS